MRTDNLLTVIRNANGHKILVCQKKTHNITKINKIIC